MRLTNTEYEQLVNFIDTCGMSFDEAMDRLTKVEKVKALSHGCSPTCGMCLDKLNQLNLPLPGLEEGQVGTEHFNGA